MITNRALTRVRFYQVPPQEDTTIDELARALAFRSTLLAKIAGMMTSTKYGKWEWQRRDAVVGYLDNLPGEPITEWEDKAGFHMAVLSEGAMGIEDRMRQLVKVETWLLQARWRRQKPTITELVEFLRLHYKDCREEGELPDDIVRKTQQAYLSTVRDPAILKNYFRHGADSVLVPKQILSVTVRAIRHAQSPPKKRSTGFYNKPFYCYLGRAYFHLEACEQLCVNVFKEHMRNCLHRAATRKVLKRPGKFADAVMAATKYGGLDPYKPKFVHEDAEQGPAWTLDQGQSAPKPPCIQAIVDGANLSGHVGFTGRTTLMLWLKGIGVSASGAKHWLIDQKLLHAEEQGDLERSIDEIWRKKYSCRSCRKIQEQGVSATYTTTHGCPPGNCIRCIKVADMEDLFASAENPEAPLLRNPSQWTLKKVPVTTIE